MNPITATTAQGPVTGEHGDGLCVFRGIPFARPPMGELRFKPPEPPESWQEPLDCKAFGPYAPQARDGIQQKYWALGGAQGEDCLTLNVWTPANDDRRRPVMVWIHGGAFVVGAAKRPVSFGHSLSRTGDVVVVTVNYRLGALGWLHLDDIDPSLAGSGNNGLLDQIAALEWVRDNIGAFGGDPDNVTLFGESAGGISVSVLLTVARARCLFHKAIAQSGAGNVVRTLTDARFVTQRFVEKTGADSLEKLRALPTDEILKTQDWLYTQVRIADSMFSPVMDANLVPITPMGEIFAGAGDDIPLLIGCNLDEYRYWLMVNPHLSKMGSDKLHKAIRRAHGGIDPGALIATYRENRPELTDNQIAIALIGDMAFRIPSTRIAESRGQRGATTFAYLFTRPSAQLDGTLGAAHAMEIPFVFNTLDEPNVPDLIGSEPDRQALADKMQSAWIAFARTGNPSTPSLAWPTYDPAERSTMVFDSQTGIVRDPYGTEREAWHGANFETQP